MGRSSEAWTPAPSCALAPHVHPAVAQLVAHPVIDAGAALLPEQAPKMIFFLDTETTGLSRTTDRVVEIAVAAVDRHTWAALWQRTQLIDPARVMPAAASAINGITTAMLRGKPSFVDVWPKIAAKVPAGSTVVAHNASYDRARLESECARTRYPAPDWAWEDSRALARKVLPGRSHKLQDLRDLLRTSGSGAHRALGDVQTLIAVYRALVERQAEEAQRATRDAAPLLSKAVAA